MVGSSLVGRRFGRLEVTEALGKRKRESLWGVRCDCGTVKQITRGNLLSGRVNSCGCLNREKLRERSITHGMAGTRIYRVYHSMWSRCYLTTDTNYIRYGAKGITVDPSWHTFEQFFADMGEPEGKKDLDRIDNTKGYSKENCRWATREENANNKSNNVKFTFDGKTLSLKEWSKLTRIKATTLASRLYLYKWPVERAFTEKVKVTE